MVKTPAKVVVEKVEEKEVAAPAKVGKYMTEAMIAEIISQTAKSVAAAVKKECKEVIGEQNDEIQWLIQEGAQLRRRAADLEQEVHRLQASGRGRRKKQQQQEQQQQWPTDPLVDNYGAKSESDTYDD